MSDVVVFAGTTEGCEICSFLAKNKVSVLACVATDYGSKSLKEDEYLKIHAGRLNGTEMEKLLKKLSPGHHRGVLRLSDRKSTRLNSSHT